ncbi:uncharacterized protein LOC125017132 [Mugil cephalus]|uniref:uncharacterized protein LOC125017132 n=1 Tax=Mugil cephalus TaxID=48193 RepID=UPI001FB61BCA|nr:uncharacterized protein LOC125017132 [Mugil cephalus]
MSPLSFNIFIVFSLIFHQSHAFRVIQPQVQTVNPDKSATISCEHTASSSTVKDIRLNSISTGKPSKLWQKGMNWREGENITVYQEKENKYVFILFGIGPEAMRVTYECEITVQNNELDSSVKGTPTRLIEGRGETEDTSTPPSPPPSMTTPPLQPDQLRWILIALLTLTVLYSCVITSLYITWRNSSKDCENSTYVEMRKAPLPRNQYE